MNITKYIFSVIIVFSLFSCEDFFSTNIELDQPEYEKQLVISSVVLNDQENLPVYIGKNSGLFDDLNDSEFKVDNALMTVTRDRDGFSFNSDDNALADPPDPNYNYYMARPDKDFFESGESYTFKAEHPDYPMSETTLTYPSKSVLTGPPVFKLEDGVDDEGDPASSINISFQDNPDEVNYYELEVRYFPEHSNGEFYYSIYVFAIDPATEKGRNDYNVLLSDESFNGQLKELEVKISRDEIRQPEDRMELHWHSINEGYYLFDKTLEKYNENRDNPFESPVQVYSNVNDGLGVITMKNTSVYEVVF